MSDSNLLKSIKNAIHTGIDWDILREISLVDSKELRKIQKIAGDIRSSIYGNKIEVYFPGHDFPAISVTGAACELNCLHCNKKYLKGMIPARTPDELYRRCKILADRKAVGCLISGGCNETGAIPLEPFLETIARIKRETSLILNLHTGLLSEEVAQGLAQAKVDMVSFDINVDSQVIRDVYHLNACPKDYRSAVYSLIQRGVRVAPHVCIGLSGKRSKEIDALELIGEFATDRIVFIVLIPPKSGQDFFQTPKVLDVAKIIAIARLKFPKRFLTLGCMRPKNRNERLAMEQESIRSGINGMVLPSSVTLDRLKERGFLIEHCCACCAIS